MYSKKKRVKKKKKINLSGNKKYYIILGIIAIVLAVGVFSSFYIVLGSYNGLGLAKNVDTNEYSMSNVYSKNGLMYYDDSDYTSIAAIDVSTFQDEIDWTRVKSAGIDLAMIRIGYRGSTDGGLFLDERFKENLKGAKEAGIEVGVYFFAQTQTIEEAEEDARFVVRHIRGKGVTGPVAFDMEPISEDDRISNLSTIEKTEITDAFLTIVKRNGYKPMVYGNQSWLSNSLDMSYLTEYDVWLAQYNETTDFPSDFAMWQYTDSGKIDGIDGTVDLNLMLIKKK